MKKDRSRDKIEAMKYNLSLSHFCPLSTIHVADPPTVSITFEGIIIIDHPPSPSFPRTLSSRPSTRIELSANCHRSRRSRGRKIVNTRIRSFLWHRDLSLSLSLFVLVSKISKLVGFREEQACDENDYFCTNKNSLIL